jgi:hypothetical protein
MRAELAALALVAGCAFEDGEGFATIESASLDVSFDPGSRRFPDGSLLVREGWRLELDSLSIEIGPLALVEARTSGGGGGGIFDPAHPPPGYGTCHAGHCHHEDGRVVSYEDIQAELSGGGGTTFAELVEMPIGAVDLTAPRTLDLARFEPSPFLPQSTIARATLGVTHLSAAGRIGSDTLDPVAITVDLAPADLAFVASLSPMTVSRDSPESLRVTGALTLGPTLFDGVDYGALVEGGAISIDAESDAGAVLLENVADAAFAVTLQGS